MQSNLQCKELEEQKKNDIELRRIDEYRGLMSRQLLEFAEKEHMKILKLEGLPCKA